MDTYFRILCGALIASVLVLVLPDKGKNFGVLLIIGACTMALAAGIRFLTPILDFIQTLRVNTGLPDDFFRILLKVLAVGLSSEIAVALCNMSGASAMGKTVELLGTILIVSFTVPLYTSILELIQKLVGNL